MSVGYERKPRRDAPSTKYGSPPENNLHSILRIVLFIPLYNVTLLSMNAAGRAEEDAALAAAAAVQVHAA